MLILQSSFLLFLSLLPSSLSKHYLVEVEDNRAEHQDYKYKYKANEGIQDTAECIIRSSLNKTMYELYKKQNVDEKNVVIEKISKKLINILKSPIRPTYKTPENTKKKLRKKKNKKDKKMAKCVKQLFEKEGIDLINEIVNKQVNGDYIGDDGDIIGDVVNGIENGIEYVGSSVGCWLGAKLGNLIGGETGKNIGNKTGCWIGEKGTKFVVEKVENTIG